MISRLIYNEGTNFNRFPDMPLVELGGLFLLISCFESHGGVL